ncbi:MAG: OmpA family protein [Pseudomonadota bacterium]
MTRFPYAFAFLAVALSTSTVSAQVVSSDDIEAALKRQEQILNSDNGVAAGETRGIRLANPSGTKPKAVVSKRSEPAAKTAAANTPKKPAATTVKATTPTKKARVQKASTRVQPPRLPEGEQLDLVILFEYDSAFIRPESRPQLEALCSAINKGASDRRFHIIGHTDAAGSNRYNMTLSEARAKEVKRHLVTECQIDASRLNPVGMGEERLLKGLPGGDDAQRRVEILLNIAS